MTKKCSEGLGFVHFCVKSPCNSFINDYTQAFYVIHEGDVPSVQYEMNLRWCKSMREVDGPSFTLIDFNVAALTPQLH
jgi:hypothetical protein